MNTKAQQSDALREVQFESRYQTVIKKGGCQSYVFLGYAK